MKFFIDTADIDAISELAKTGLVDGITTNPSLIAKSGGDFKETIGEIAKLVDGPISAEVLALDSEGMMREAETLLKIASNIAIKLPLTWDGLKACKALTDAGNMVNVTLCFSLNQAVLAAKAGASFISPFIGRLDDLAVDGLDLIADIRQAYDNYGFSTELLAASIRSAEHAKECALIGADVITMPPSIMHELIKHPLTDKGIEMFLADAKKAGTKV